jgi:flavin-dependent dehydrogenase
VAGTGDLPNFFSTPYGPGWALAGDAGYHRDPLTAQGISDAFRDAQLLSEAIDAGLAGRQPLAEALAGVPAAARRGVDGHVRADLPAGRARAADAADDPTGRRAARQPR